MNEHLEYTLDKFTFRVATDRLYMPEGIWAKVEGDLVRVGVSDFFQQHNGDVAFVEVREVGTVVSPDEEFASIETIKVDFELPAPVHGVIVAVNDRLELEAEIINLDPYGAGWMALIAATDWATDQARLMSPAAYFAYMQAQAQEKLN